MKLLLGVLAAFAAYEWLQSQHVSGMNEQPVTVPAAAQPGQMIALSPIFEAPVMGPVMSMSGVPRSAVFFDNGSGIGVLNGIGRFGQRRIA